MRISAFLLFLILFCSSCSKGLRGTLLGEWKLTVVENKCSDKKVEIYEADDSDCNELETEIIEGLITFYMVCESIVFEGEKAYWKTNERTVPATKDFTFEVDESKTIIALCSSSECLNSEYKDEELRWVIPNYSTTINSEVVNCQRT